MLPAEVALAVLLLVGAGLLWRSLQRIVAIDPGFEPAGVLTARVQLPMPWVSEQWPQAVEFFERFENRARSLPGVVSVASAYQLPTDSGWNNGFEFAGAGDATRLRPLGEGDIANGRFRPVTPGYFETAGVRLLRGRTFTRADNAQAPRVVMANESFVRQYFLPGAEVLGTRLDYGNWWAGGAPEYEIIGVVQDVRFSGRATESYPATRRQVRRMVLLSGLRLTALGLGLGLIAAYLLGGLMSSLLYEVEPTDAPTFALVAAFLGASALAASWLPAYRATRIDPMHSLRAE